MKQIIATILSAAIAWFIPHTAIDEIARLLVPAVALMATSIFPCMTLVVGSLKGEQRSTAVIDQLHGRLRAAMEVLVTAFAVAVVAMLLTIIASTLSAVDIILYRVSLTSAVTALAGACFAILVGRVIAVGKIFFEVLDINRKHALLIARAKSGETQIKALSQIKMPSADTSPPKMLIRPE
jgi:mannitol-specific phosphotransferase system IIBC component